MKKLNLFFVRLCLIVMGLIVVSLSAELNQAFAQDESLYNSMHQKYKTYAYRDASNEMKTITYHGFNQLHDLDDPIVACQKEEWYLCDAPTSKIYLDIDRPKEKLFKVFVPPHITSVDFYLLSASGAGVGAAIRFGKPPEGSYNVSTYGEFQSMPWDDWSTGGTSLSYLKDHDFLSRETEGIISLVMDNANANDSVPPTGDWLYVKILDIGYSVMYLRYFLGVDIPNYMEWFRNAQFDENGDPIIQDTSTGDDQVWPPPGGDDTPTPTTSTPVPTPTTPTPAPTPTPTPAPTPAPQPSPGTSWPPAGWPPTNGGWYNPGSTPDEPTPSPEEPVPNSGDNKPGDGYQNQGWPPPETKAIVIEGKSLGWVIDPVTIHISRSSNIFFNPKLYIGDAFQGQDVDCYGLVMAGDQFYTAKYDNEMNPYFDLFSGQVESYGRSAIIDDDVWNCRIVNSLIIDTDILLDENVVFYYGISPVGEFSKIRFGAVRFDDEDTD